MTILSDNRNVAAILAGLRLLQIYNDGNLVLLGVEGVYAIASDCGTLEPLSNDEIDDLCIEINTGTGGEE
jgi:hypothetical protein